MKSIFIKTKFPKATGGNLYEWQNAQTSFAISKTGLFAIKVVASAKNGKQNNSNDDDDLRVVLDGFSFGKYEQHEDKISWKGFGTSASFDGASLNGGTKTIYFFVELDAGEHTVQFFADQTPAIRSLEILAVEDNQFALADIEPPENTASNRKGIPWISFVFLGTHAKNILLDVATKSGKERDGTDGDNLKVVLNGRILQNEQFPNSKKYKNFYFSGDIKSAGILSIANADISTPLAFENSIELWYDKEPKINSLQINFFDTEKFLEELEEMDLRRYVIGWVWAVGIYFRKTSKPYSEKFLKHSLEAYPESIVFKANHPIVRKIKADATYKKIIKKLKERIFANAMEGEIWPGDIEGGIIFDSHDLKYAIHGIKKIEYLVSTLEDNEFNVKMVLFDVYDFDKQDVPFFLFHGYEYTKRTILNTINSGEDLHVIHNFEIQIHIIETMHADH